MPSLFKRQRPTIRPWDNKAGQLPPPTQDHIAIRDVRDNVIVRHDGALVAVIGVEGLNMKMLDPGEQDRAIAMYREMLIGLEFGWQTLIIARPQNIDAHLQVLHERAQKHRAEGNLRYYQLLLRYIDLYNQLAWDAMALVREYRIVVLYLHPGIEQLKGRFGRRTLTAEVLDEGLTELDRRVRRLQSYLGQMGLKTRVLSDAELKQELYLFYHPALQAADVEIGRAPKAIRGA